MSLLRRVLPLLAFGPSFAFVACSSSSSSGSNGAPDAAVDSSLDAASPDASHDGAADSAADSVSDAGSDGSREGSTPPAEAGADAGGCDVPTTPVGTGTLTGTINANAPLTVADVSVVMARTSPGAGPWILTIGFSDFAHVCGYHENAATPAGSNIDSIVIQTSSEAATSPFTVGTYQQAGLGEVDAGAFTYDISLDLESFDGTCNDSSSRASVNGTVTLTNAGPTEVAGSYDLMLANGEISGQFDASVCTPAAPTTTRVCCP